MQRQNDEDRLTVDKGGALESVAAYRLAVEAGEEGWEDATIMRAEPLLADAAPQLVRAIGSIAANIAEGYARRSARDRIRYYEYALGSVEESCTWYQVARHSLTVDTLSARLKRLVSMRRLLLVMISNERRGHEWNHGKQR